MTIKTDVLIVGGGLAGLSIADHLHREGRDFQLVEARNRFGGRILTEHNNAGYFDMGPAWFWHGQPRMAQLLQRFGLSIFEQYSKGILTHEDTQGRVERGKGFSSMQGSYRVQGGLQALIDALVSTLSSDHLHLKFVLNALIETAEGISAVSEDGHQIDAHHVVLALPPRVAAERITFHPHLSAQATEKMQAIPTWMAGQAKALALYETPFWRNQGLSGDAMSRVGPMVEIHDASPATDGPFGLFGFIGVPPSSRTDQAQLKQHILAQFVRLFGPEASDPVSLYLKDWAFDPLTATPLDQAPLYAHPHYGLPDVLNGLWNGRLLFGGTEIAQEFGGYLEGALEAAEAVHAQLTDSLR